jgi:hypothetical protein
MFGEVVDGRIFFGLCQAGALTTAQRSEILQLSARYTPRSRDNDANVKYALPQDCKFLMYNECVSTT